MKRPPVPTRSIRAAAAIAVTTLAFVGSTSPAEAHITRILITQG